MSTCFSVYTENPNTKVKSLISHSDFASDRGYDSRKYRNVSNDDANEDKVKPSVESPQYVRTVSRFRQPCEQST